MRILHIITSLATGGAEKLMVDLLPRLRDEGNEVELLCFDGRRTQFYKQLEATGIKIYSFKAGAKLYNPWNIVRIARLLRKGKYDIVHTHNTAAQLFAAAAKVVCSVVLVTTEHTTSNRRRDWKWYAPIDRWMYHRYNAVICISDQTETNLRGYIGKGQYNICTIYNGIDIERFAVAEADSNLLRRKRQKKAIVMVAGFRCEKDQDTLIRAMVLLPKDKYELWLVGDGERRGVLEILVKENCADGNVLFLGLRCDVPNVMKAADFVVMSSHWEGFGLAAVEGMAAGKPVIASNVDGLAQVVEGAGLLFPHGNAKAFADLVINLSEDEGLKERVAAACQKKAEQYDIKVMAKKYNDLYKTLK